jgi:hypothetical protein
MSKVITRAEVAEALDKVVAERGQDYVYPRAENGDQCLYSFEDGRPACIVGAVIALVDPEGFERIVEKESPQPSPYYGEEEVLVRREAGSVKAIAAIVGKERGPEYGAWKPFVTFEDEATVDALLEAQRAQDVNRPWGEARQEFVDAVRAA